MSHLFSQIRRSVQPSAAAKRRVTQRLQRSVKPPAASVFQALQPELKPSTTLKSDLWGRLARRLESEVSVAVIKSPARATLSTKERVKKHVMARIAAMGPSVRPYRLHKWVAAFTVFTLMVSLSPVLFLAPPTVADSVVRLVITEGTAEVYSQGMWQPAPQDLVIEPGMIIRTQAGQVTMPLHGVGVVRLDSNTTVAVHEVDSRPTNVVHPSSFTLYTGRMWLWSLAPGYMQGFTVTTSYGDITVNEGSVSIAEDDRVDVLVYDRRATMRHNGQEVALVAGERTQTWEDSGILVKKITEEASDWVTQNLARDAVHRTEIAQKQQQLRVSQAGILPGSSLYPVKRVAEAVDVFFAFGEAAKMQKKLAHANTRLNEAAALIAEDQAEEAKGPLVEYQKTLQALAQDIDSNFAQQLLQQTLVETSVGVAAVQPDDDSYLLKQVVLEAGLSVDGVVSNEDVKAVLVTDTLAMLTAAVAEGQVANTKRTWQDLQPLLASLEAQDVELQADIRKEINGLLQRFALAVAERKPQMLALDPELVDQVEAYLPTEQADLVPIMSAEEIQSIVQGIRDRIFLYNMTQSRINQFFYETKLLEGHPEQGRILRRLAFALPGGPENFPLRVKKQITALRWSRLATL